MNNTYVISIKRICDYYNNPLENHKWEYAMIDTNTSYSTGYPMFGSEEVALKFDSVEEANVWWEVNKRYFTDQYMALNRYDISTLAIRKHISIYKSVEKLTIMEDV